MASTDGFLRATGRLLVLLALVAVPAAIYVFVVVRGQAVSATAQSLRAVGEVGAQLDDRLDALRQVAVNALKANKTESRAGQCPRGKCEGNAASGDTLAQLRSIRCSMV